MVDRMWIIAEVVPLERNKDGLAQWAGAARFEGCRQIGKGKSVQCTHRHTLKKIAKRCAGDIVRRFYYAKMRTQCKMEVLESREQPW